MTKFRIVEFSTTAKIGGTQKMLLDFLRHASRHRFDFFHGVLLEHDVLIDEIAKLNIPQFTLNMRGYWDIRVWWKLYTVLRTLRADLLRTYGLKADVIGRIVGKAAGIPVNVTSVQSTDPWRKWYHVLLDRGTSGLTDAYLSNSEAGRQAIHQRERIPLSKIATALNGIELDRFDPDRIQPARVHALRERFGLRSSDKIIGIVANLCQMKGHRDLIDALPRIHARWPQAKCLFVGIDSLNGAIQAYAHERQAERHIVFAGFQTDIPECLMLMDIVALPSLWEGLPNAVLEAMAMKRPVIATPVGDIPNIVAHGDTGLLIPTRNPDALADAVIALFDSPEQAAALAEAGYRFVRANYSIQMMVERTEALYERLILEHRLRRAALHDDIRAAA